MTTLNVHTFGPEDGAPVLAVHGLSGHGRRWEPWSHYLPEARVIAPDILGHGRSPYEPPWAIENQVACLIEVLDAHSTTPVLVVGHSYGGALAVHLSRTVPDRVRGLLLLDPAIGLDPARMLAVAESTARHSEYADAAEARDEKVHGSWSDVDPALVDSEIEEHLVPAPGGRVRWRTSTAAMVGVCNELARPLVLPPPSIPVTLVQAMRVRPPYVTAALRDGLQDGSRQLRVEEFDCGHMVTQAEPVASAALARDLLVGTAP